MQAVKVKAEVHVESNNRQNSEKDRRILGFL